MKKLNKIIFTIVLTLSIMFTVKVNAVTQLNKTGIINSSMTYTKEGQTWHNNIVSYKTVPNDYDAYCIDPALYGNLNGLSERKLVDNTTGRQRAYEISLMSAMENAYNADYDYETTTNALRFLTVGMGMARKGTYPGGDDLNSTFIVTFANWISEKEENYTYWYQAFYGVNPPTKLSGNSAKRAIYDAVSYTEQYTPAGYITPFGGADVMLLNIKGLAINALRTAAQSRINNSQTSTDAYKIKLSDSGLIKESTKNGNKYLTRDIVYVVNTSIYDRNAGFVKNVTLSSSYSKFMTLQYSTDGVNYQTLSSSTNLVALGVDKVYIRVHIDATKADFPECETISYTLSYRYYDPSMQSVGYMLYAGLESQRFVYYTRNTDLANGGMPDSIPGTTELCGACETDVTIPKDCTELGDTAKTDDIIGGIKAPTNVSKCILKKNDDAGNSYMLTANNGGTDASNPYCSIWCKEDYAVVRFSGVKRAQSGRYFKVQGRIEGTKTCYTSSGTTSNTNDNRINIEKYQSDIADAQVELVEAYKEYLKVTTACSNSNSGYTTGSVTVPDYVRKNNGEVSLNGTKEETYEYNASDCSGLKTQAQTRLTNAQNNYNNINNQYGQCTNWTNNFKFDQDIYYTYQENYQKLLNDEQTKMAKTCSGKDCVTSTSDWYCTGDSVGSEYNNCSGSTSTTNPTTTRTYLYCDNNGCSTKNEIVSTSKYVKRTVNAAADYTTQNQFYNIYTSGKVTVKDVLNSDLNGKLVDGSPVSVKTEKGVYTFTYRLANLGEFYNTGDSGRISGSNTSVIKTLKGKGTINFDGDYICYYTVNCPECDYTCDDDNDCEWDPVCPTCTSTCVNCIYDTNKLNVSFRQISSEDVNPNDRNLGYNWNENTEFKLISEKAEDTKKEIEQKGASVEEETPILSVEMTPDLAKSIREYNENNESNGGYTNESMSCYDYDDGQNKYTKVFCFSKFLDEMSEKYSDSFKFIDTDTDKRISKEERDNTKDSTQLARKITQSGYWTIYKKSTDYTLGDYNGVVGGPSWK